jgi:hypothetical protein
MGSWVPSIEHVGKADNSNESVESTALSWGTTHVVRDAILDRLEGWFHDRSEFSHIWGNLSWRVAISTQFPTKEAAIHHLDSWAILSSMNGSNILGEGDGWHVITVRARIVLGPHSLECGKSVKLLQLIQIESWGWNESEVWEAYFIQIVSAVLDEFISSEYIKKTLPAIARWTRATQWHPWILIRIQRRFGVWCFGIVGILSMNEECSVSGFPSV